MRLTEELLRRALSPGASEDGPAWDQVRRALDRRRRSRRRLWGGLAAALVLAAVTGALAPGRLAPRHSAAVRIAAPAPRQRLATRATAGQAAPGKAVFAVVSRGAAVQAALPYAPPLSLEQVQEAAKVPLVVPRGFSANFLRAYLTSGPYPGGDPRRRVQRAVLVYGFAGGEVRVSQTEVISDRTGTWRVAREDRIGFTPAAGEVRSTSVAGIPVLSWRGLRRGRPWCRLVFHRAGTLWELGAPPQLKPQLLAVIQRLADQGIGSGGGAG
jgi:hypothetical protein